MHGIPGVLALRLFSCGTLFINIALLGKVALFSSCLSLVFCISCMCYFLCSCLSLVTWPVGARARTGADGGMDGSSAVAISGREDRSVGCSGARSLPLSIARGANGRRK